MGRPPKPTVLKVLNGSAEHHPERVNATEPKAEPLTAVPPPPGIVPLDARGMLAWGKLAELTIGLGVLTAADLPALELICEAISDSESADSPVTRSSARNFAWLGMGKFGLNPSDRSKVHVAQSGKVDPMAALMQSRRKSS